MMQVIERKIDPQGRISLPKSWKHGNKVVLVQKDDEIMILPSKYKRLLDIPEKTIDVKSDLNDWHSLKNELLRIK